MKKLFLGSILLLLILVTACGASDSSSDVSQQDKPLVTVYRSPT